MLLKVDTNNVSCTYALPRFLYQLLCAITSENAVESLYLLIFVSQYLGYNFQIDPVCRSFVQESFPCCNIHQGFFIELLRIDTHSDKMTIPGCLRMIGWGKHLGLATYERNLQEFPHRSKYGSWLCTICCYYELMNFYIRGSLRTLQLPFYLFVSLHFSAHKSYLMVHQ